MAMLSIMSWNWQLAEWPRFHWDRERLATAEILFAECSGIAVGASKHLSDSDREALRIEMMSHEAIDTSAIEGEMLDRESVQSSIRRHLGLNSDQRRIAPAEAGIAEVMIDLYNRVSEPVTEGSLRGWHRSIMRGRADLADIGRYRTGGDPMQIVSGPIGRPRVHFEAPPAADVPEHMKTFVSGLARSAPSGPSPLPPLTRAGLAHIWFESIHPYEDGNGRIGRAISEKLLAQERPTTVLTGISGALLLHRKAYYAALERAHSDLDITEWLLWFGAKAIEAQRRTLQLVDFVLAKARLMNSLHGLINARQERVLLRMFNAGPAGFRGGLSAANYMSITGAPTATTTRDLSTLVAMGALLRTGNLKSTRYQLNIDLAPVNAVDVSEIS